MTRYNGTEATTGNSSFRSYVDIEILSYDATGINYRYRKGIEVTKGDFYGTVLKGDFAGYRMNKPGNVGITSWTTTHANYGTSPAISTSSNYSDGVRTYTASASHTITVGAAPVAPTIGANTRVSDNQNTISWTAGTDTRRTGYIIQRSTNGGAWETLGTVSNSANSFVDNSTTFDTTNAYRVGGLYAGNYAVYSAESNATSNTPAAPVSIQGARTSSNIIAFTVENYSAVATGVKLERSLNGVDGWASATTATGSPVTSLTYSTTATYYYRIANTVGGLASDWVYTDTPIVVISTAAAPTITSPAQGSLVCTYRSGFANWVTWTHNPTDGTAQTKAEVWLRGNRSTEQGTWTKHEITGETNRLSLDMAASLYSNGSLDVRVCTAGANEVLSEYAEEHYNVVSAPSGVVSILGDDNYTVHAMPIPFSGIYNAGANGYKIVSSELRITKDGKLVYSAPIDIENGVNAYLEVSANDFIPENNTEYQYYEIIRSSTGYGTSTSNFARYFTTDFNEPQHALLDTKPDDETGYCTINVSYSSEGDPAEYANIYRVVGDEVVLVAEQVHDGTEIVDRYAPLNTPYQYKSVAFSDVGVAGIEFKDVIIETPRFFCYWGNNIAWARWNPTGSWSRKSSDARLVHYDGRKDPVLYKGSGLTKTNTVGATLFEREEIEAFKRMIDDGATCVYKSIDGEVFHAYAELSGNNKFKDPFRSGEVSITLTRIDGGQL